MKNFHPMYYQYGIGGDGIVKVQEQLESNRIPKWWLLHSLSLESDFVDFLNTFLTPEQVWHVMEDYALGATKDRSVIFWQVDFCRQIRSGKIVAYYPQNHPKFGHRNKQKKPYWVHSTSQIKTILPPDWRLEQCLFGEHLLHRYHNKDVAIVEAEKTACICSALYPDYIWVSCGGKESLSEYKCRALRGRNVTIFPDTDLTGQTFSEWNGQAQKIKFICNKVVVSDILERLATYEQKFNKIDIADLLIYELQGEQQAPQITTQPPVAPVSVQSVSTSESEPQTQEDELLMVMMKSPAIKLLVDTFDLEVIENENKKATIRRCREGR